MLTNINLFLLLFMILNLFGCSKDNIPSSHLPYGEYNPNEGDISNNNDNTTSPNDTSGSKGTWDISKREIITGCLGLDCIPSLQNPEFISLEAATYLNDDDLVYGLVIGDEVRAYPHRILDWHEIINQNFNIIDISITYCPLTGSGVALESEANTGHFGVSGFLYNNNLIPYDRGTFSNWSQMLLRCVNGVLRGTPMITVPLIETSWETWNKMFPNSKVVSDNTGIDRPYDIFPYGNYKTEPFLLFPIMIDDTRLPRKERVHGIITDRFQFKAKTYRFSLFENGARAINDEVDGQPVVVAGMKSADFYISYSRLTRNRTVLTFDLKTESPNIYPFDLVDNEGNVWNILGEAISGPRTGEKLTTTVSYNAYWFAWGTFFPNVPIY